MPIPKIIHQIWIQGYDYLPEKLKNKHNLIKKFNPNYQVILWDNVMIDSLLYKYPNIHNVYNNIPNFTGKVKINPSKSDIARLLILYEFGGFYIDIDYYCPKSLDELYDQDDQLVVSNSAYVVLKYLPLKYKPKYCACFMAIIPNHAIFDIIFNELIKLDDRDKIGILMDRVLQDNTNLFQFKVISLNKVSPHSSCVEGICYAPKKSSSIIGRDFLIFIGCKIKYIIVILILILLIIIYNNI